MAVFGYARVSTIEQNLDLQLDALKAAGCERIFIDKASGISIQRDGWEELENTAQEGDTIIVWKLDRLGRSMLWLCETLANFQQHNIIFKSLQESIDTHTATGRLFIHIIASLAQFEREILSDRTREGMKAAQRRGKHTGRPHVATQEQLELAAQLLTEGKKSWPVAARTVGLSESTLRRRPVNLENARFIYDKSRGLLNKAYPEPKEHFAIRHG